MSSVQPRCGHPVNGKSEVKCQRLWGHKGRHRPTLKKPTVAERRETRRVRRERTKARA